MARQGQAAGASAPWYGMVLNGTLAFDLTTFDFEEDVARALYPDQALRRTGHGSRSLTFPAERREAAAVGGMERSAMVAEEHHSLLQAGRRRSRPPASCHHRDHSPRRWKVPELERDSLERTQKYARLFMAPGMGHCGGGDGPNSFDTFVPLVDWVERGKAPTKIVATKFVNNQSAQGIERTRPLCAYPASAIWDGKGDPALADSFRCVTPRGLRDGHGDHHDDHHQH